MQKGYSLLKNENVLLIYSKDVLSAEHIFVAETVVLGSHTDARQWLPALGEKKTNIYRQKCICVAPDDTLRFMKTWSVRLGGQQTQVLCLFYLYTVFFFNLKVRTTVSVKTLFIISYSTDDKKVTYVLDGLRVSKLTARFLNLFIEKLQNTPQTNPFVSLLIHSFCNSANPKKTKTRLACLGIM